MFGRSVKSSVVGALRELSCLVSSLPMQHPEGSNSIYRPFLPLVVALLILTCNSAAAQIGADEAHILPRGRSMAPTPASTAARQVIRANVDLVLVDVTVLDHDHRAVTGLQATDFMVLDEDSPQVVRYVSNVDEPISLVVVFDASASMAARIKAAKSAIKELINGSNAQDDFSVIIVQDEPKAIFHFDDPAIEMQRAIDGIQSDGATSLWDGMYLGVKELRSSHYRRQAMVVISDGGDNHSRYTQSELKSLLEEAGVEVYAIGMFDRAAKRLEEKNGPLLLDEVTSVTGGRMFTAFDSADLPRIATQISRELRNQYVLGYYPSNRSRDGKWRKLKVRLSGPAAGTKFHLYTKKGYYAPAE